MIRCDEVRRISKKPSLVKAVLLATSFLTTTQRNTDRVYQAESKCAGWKTDATTDRQGWNKEQLRTVSRTHFFCEGTTLGQRDHSAFVYHSPYSIPMIVVLDMLRHAGGQAQTVCGSLYRCWLVRWDVVSPRLWDEFKAKIHIRCGKEMVVAARTTTTVINKKMSFTNRQVSQSIEIG